ncbi:facilitated trehalose transporter Tret1-2 homolog isoform X3 [Cryptotermes secundus]|uniref:facilitated trehalose transporter Tret1-2 homolog isoform X3 n=1 Tax=Cryptotermes secundus TaxID=105785 RepID=UPI000CD7C134|nr:facilitated trehalose transporter Tret1-2 homolog isoform X3 [Cryptotermes secundus]
MHGTFCSVGLPTPGGLRCCVGSRAIACGSSTRVTSSSQVCALLPAGLLRTVAAAATSTQLAVGAVANLGTIASGMTLGFSAVALPVMQAEDHTPYISDEQASWIASLVSLGMPAGCLLMSPLLDRLGRRRSMMLVNAPAVLGWFLIATASHSEPWFLYQVYAGRLLTGFATGLVSTPAVVYVGEVLHKKWRAVVVTWPSFGISLGIVAVYTLGALFQDNWRLVAGVCCFLPAVSIAAVWAMLPESPVWLLSRGRAQEAEASLRYIRSVPTEDPLPDNLQQELDDMMHSSGRLDKTNSWKDILGFLRKPEAYKPLLIFNAFFFFQQFSGIFVVIMYAVTIVREIGVHVDGYLVTVLIGISRLVMSVVISCASKRCGRRLLCNISGVGMTLSSGVLAGFLSLMHDGYISHEAAVAYGWIPITALLLSVLTGNLGFLTLPFAMLGEVFPAKIRGWACGVTTFIATLYSFLAIKLFPDMRHWMGYHNVFTLYTAVVAIGTVTMYFFLPETHGKSLQEIEEFFRSRRKAADGDKAAKKLMAVSEGLPFSRSNRVAAGGDKTAACLLPGPE